MAFFILFSKLNFCCRRDTEVFCNDYFRERILMISSSLISSEGSIFFM